MKTAKTKPTPQQPVKGTARAPQLDGCEQQLADAVYQSELKRRGYVQKPKARKICPMCEAHGAGPCDECDRLNRKRVNVTKNAERLAEMRGLARGTAAWSWCVFGYTRGHRAATRRLS